MRASAHDSFMEVEMDSAHSNKLVLIVDDTPENIDVLNGLLKNFRKMVATNGTQALTLARGAKTPDLILLDIEMPGMSGFDVCRELKNDPFTSKIPVIFLTANMDKKITVEGFRVGAVDFMTKPFDPGELMVRIRTQLDLSEARERLESLVHQMEVSSDLLKNSSEELLQQKAALEEARSRADQVLLNMLPASVAQELKEKGVVAPRQYAIVTVLFADLVGFTKISSGLSPEALVEELNYLFTGFDNIIERNKLEKIKTLGDGYMAAGGIPLKNSSNPLDAVNAGLAMLEFVRERKEANLKSGYPPWDVRIGIHTGQVIAGVIGRNKFIYDIWGAAVNSASRMESAGEPGKVNISGITYQLVKDKFRCTRRGNIEVKNMGKMDMYFVDEPLIRKDLFSPG